MKEPEPSVFFVRAANPPGGDGGPDGVNVPTAVLVQKLGVTTQAGMVRRVASVRK